MSALLPRKITIIGSGYIGRLLAAHLSSVTEISLVSARELIAQPKIIDRIGVTLQTVIFAHGQSVNVRDFRQRFDEILYSRVQPLEILAALAIDRVILISSTTAAEEGAEKSLPQLQRTFERRFRDCFPPQSQTVLRVGTLVGEGTQFTHGLQQLGKTFLLKRLRSRGSPSIPWADPQLVYDSVRAALEAETPQNWIVAHERTLDLNSALDDICDQMRITVPHGLFVAIWRAFGIQPEFISTDHALLHKHGWAFPPAM
ncbi:hypothetical protein ASD52_09655 [Ensifer sp. Root142]|uniref:hypothetical protein n=1 Tax=Ensifer sp. Root142 TaxID=1736461 RepID=UPI00070E88DB|nr:hypothetical protein [Ensifer sp. Root142]KQY66901.1 hypothetical protein ASD52_09655 [Ensifer sp. Root142]